MELNASLFGREKRSDGRFPHQLRPPAVELGLLHRADGSARFRLGDTSVTVAVYGPSEAQQHRKTLLDREL